MKAARIARYGNEQNIKIEDIAIPEPSANQVQVRVAAVGLNPFDNLVLYGHARDMAELEFPATIGIDFAGTITKLGNDVSDFKVGDRVYGTANAMSSASGALAEYAITPTTNITKTPNAISDKEAAALPTASLTALKTIRQFGLKSGDRIFINGGAGGVGTSAIQLAKARGAYVVTSASADNAEYVKSLGADEVFDYNETDYLARIHDCDYLFETVRRDNISETLSVLKNGGTALSIVGPFDQEIAKKRNIIAIENPNNLDNALAKLSEAIVNGELAVHIGREFALDDTASAYFVMNNESVQGKIVIIV